MKYQKGFVPFVIIVLVVIGIVAAGGGYVVYSDIKADKKHQETIDRLGKSDEISNTQAEDTQDKDIQKKEEPTNILTTKTSATVKTNTKINCDNNWECLISAANNCQSASGIITFTDYPNPFFEGLYHSGQTKYDITLQNQKCLLIYYPLTASVRMSAEAKNQALSQGITENELQSQLDAINESVKVSLGLKTTCESDPSTVAAFLSDQRNGGTGDASFTFRGNLSASTGGSIFKTSIGKELVCSSEQPKAQINF